MPNNQRGKKAKIYWIWCNKNKIFGVLWYTEIGQDHQSMMSSNLVELCQKRRWKKMKF